MYNTKESLFCEGGSMYKLLLATDRQDIIEQFRTIEWTKLGYHKPLFAASSAEAIECIRTKALDAVGFYFEEKNATPLTRFLHNERPSLPVYSVTDDPEKQITILVEMRAVLNRIHADVSDIPYDDDMMRTMMRDELVHSLLCGEIEDYSVVERQLKLVRSHVSTTRPCMVYEMDMPQGEVYMTQHVSAADRLERALRNNFFGRYVDHIYYAVAVLSPRHIRVAAIPEAGLEQDLTDYENRANAHVEQSIEMIKEYLNLDISVAQSGMIRSLRSFCEDETSI